MSEHEEQIIADLLEVVEESIKNQIVLDRGDPWTYDAMDQAEIKLSRCGWTHNKVTKKWIKV
jgi:hypothetical protein